MAIHGFDSGERMNKQKKYKLGQGAKNQKLRAKRKHTNTIQTIKTNQARILDYLKNSKPDESIMQYKKRIQND